MSDFILESVGRRPWREADGPPPVVRCWPPAHRPALYVWSHGRWRYAPVHARQTYADGTVAYQVTVDLAGDTTVTWRLYGWPQPGLCLAHRSPMGLSSGP
ncbi:hypothetical protein ACFV2E_35260 [Streptomyces globisporus]|uniref:hypothetical protein n=1 Tax=Streptomyces globisporus TaxID=1908 RepID=UPI00367E3A1C